MMGAGLFLAKSSTGQSLTNKATDAASDFSNSMVQRTREISERAADAASAAKSLASEKINRLTDAVTSGTRSTTDEAAASVSAGFEQLRQKATSFGAAASDASANLGEQVRQAGSTVTANARDMASDAASAGLKAVEASRNMGLHAARSVQETASDLGERAGNLGERGRMTFVETIEQNPLLVAGVGLFIGGLIASAIPRSGIEDSLIGGASNSVKRQADRAAAGAVHTAKEAVGEGYDEAVRQAQAGGLTPDGLGEAARDVGERLRHVADAAVTTAFEPTQNGNSHQQRNTHGETDHG
jgi:hypothetical protein